MVPKTKCKTYRFTQVMVHFSNSNLHHNPMKKYNYYSLNDDQSTETKSCIEKMDPVRKIYVDGTFPYF